VRIPVFVSCPTELNPAQEEFHGFVLRQLKKFGLEDRALGRSDYPTEFPLREVLTIARHCAGGVILGFEQVHAATATAKRGTERPPRLKNFVAPTPWNHLEAGILFGIGLPLLVFAEKGINGGIFDHGVTDAFVHPMPSGTRAESNELREVFLKWQGAVRQRYYAI
jgi:hypothetical protein